MAKSPGKRHSGSEREPVTIDLDSDAVKHIEEADENGGGSSEEAELAAQDYGSGTPEDEAIAPSESSDTGDEAAAGGIEADGVTEESEEAAEARVVAEEETEAELAAQDYGAGDAGETAAAGEGARGSAPAAPAAPRSGLVPAIGGGLIGALIALAAAGGASYLGLLPSTGGGTEGDVKQLQIDLATLQDRVAAAEAAAQEVPAGVTQALQEARNGIDSLTKSTDALKENFADLKQAVSSGDGTVAAGGTLSGEATARLDAVDGKIGEITKTLDTLRQTTAETGDKAGGAADTARAAAESASQAAAAAGDAKTRVDALEKRVAALAGQVSEGTGQSEVARAIAATALKSAIDRGSPFMGELETFASVAGESPAIDALRAMAASGVPTRGEISEQAGNAAYAMIDAAQAPPSDASLLDRLTASAKSLVKMRPTGEVEGDSVAAVTARMTQAIERGDYAKALDEYDSLPDAPKQAGAAFAARVKARMEADKLVDDVLSSALKPQK